jgi:hypothetical protein
MVSAFILKLIALYDRGPLLSGYRAGSEGAGECCEPLKEDTKAKF